MTVYEHELMKIFGDSELLSADTVSSGKTMISKIGADLRAKIQFVTSGHANHYDALKVSIIKRNEGVVDEQRFKFSDIIGIHDGIAPYIWEYNATDIKWYKYRPTGFDYEDIQNAVEGYISMFADETMNMGSQSM